MHFGWRVESNRLFRKSFAFLSFSDDFLMILSKFESLNSGEYFDV